MTKESIPDRARRGAALLDQVRPGWWKSITPEDIEMSSCHWCILGQVYGHYSCGVDTLARTDDDLCRLGFTLSPAEERCGGPPQDAPEWADLAAAWSAEIEVRSRTEQGVPS